MTYEEFKEQFKIKLDSQQEDAVQTVDGCILLLAVPGSGKTTVLVTRLGYMLYCADIAPEKILTMTYTVSATKDMRNRFASVFGEEMADRLEFRTINGVSARIIKSYERISGRPAFGLVTDEKELSGLIYDICRRVMQEFPTDSEIKAVRTAITYAKNRMLTDGEILDMDKDIKGFSEVFKEYNRVLCERHRMDYDDQMIYALRILRQCPEILHGLEEKYSYICVDEAQDTSKIQHEIIKLLSQKSGNLFMVGDEDQSIYGFRAAYPEALTEFEQVHKGAKVLLMEHNYRSSKHIVTAADNFIKQNKNRHEKHMQAARAYGREVKRVSLHDRKSQYLYLLRVAQSCTYQTAVLYRDNDCALPLIDLLERNGVPYRCRQMDSGFFTHRVTCDICDIIRLAYNPSDSEAFLRVYYKFGAGISKTAAENAVSRNSGRPLLAVISEDATLSEWTRKKCQLIQAHIEHLTKERADKAVFRIMHSIGYGDYLAKRGLDANHAYLMEALGSQELTPARLLDRLDELKAIIESEKEVPEECCFTLSTIHSSKGLEYSRVFLLDVIDGVLPKDSKEESTLEEERRLFYVGMTRAKSDLSIFTFDNHEQVSSFSMNIFPILQTQAQQQTLPLPAVKKRVPDAWHGQALLQASKETQGGADGFVVGAKVKHRIFGKGTITEIKDGMLTVELADGTQKKLSLASVTQANALKLL